MIPREGGRGAGMRGGAGRCPRGALGIARNPDLLRPQAYDCGISLPIDIPFCHLIFQ
jgi:hypothetical protein